MKISEIQEDERDQYYEIIRKRSVQLHEASVLGQDSAIKFIFLANSGGSIAMLSFIGGLTGYRENKLIWFMLASFIIGLALVGVLHLLRLILFDNAFTAYKRDSNKFVNNNYEWDDLRSEDKKRTEGSKMERWIYKIGFASFGCFIFGVLLGLAFIFDK